MMEDENKQNTISIKINGEDAPKDTLIQGLSGGSAVKIQDSAINGEDIHINQINQQDLMKEQHNPMMMNGMNSIEA